MILLALVNSQHFQNVVRNRQRKIARLSALGKFEPHRKSGLAGVSLHSLRHSYTTEQLSKGTPIATISKILGHASVNITFGIYSHALPKDNQTAGQRWNDNNGEVIRRSLERRISRTRSVTANDSKNAGKVVVIPLESAS